MAVAPEIYARIADLSKMTDIQQIVRDVISKKPDAELYQRPRRHARLGGEEQGQRHRDRRDRFLPRRPQHLALCRAQSEAEGRGRLVWPGQGRHQPDPAADRARHRRQAEMPAAGSLWRQGHRIPVADVEEAVAKAKAAHKTVEIAVYPDAPHGFHADYRPSYRQADAEDGWNRMLAWFKQYGVAPKSGARIAPRRSCTSPPPPPSRRTPTARSPMPGCRRHWRAAAPASSRAAPPRSRRCRSSSGCATSRATSRTTRWRNLDFYLEEWEAKVLAVRRPACTGAPPPTRRATRCWRSAAPRTRAPSPRASR